MARKNMYTEAQVEEIVSKAVAKALAEVCVGKPSKKATGNTQPKAEMVEYTNAKGETKLITRKQAENYESRKHTEEEKAAWHAKREKGLADFDAKRKGYKPSKALIEAIKRDRASITRKIAINDYGFVGTKDDLKALKDSICK